jgi:hypothetical protein
MSVGSYGLVASRTAPGWSGMTTNAEATVITIGREQ